MLYVNLLNIAMPGMLRHLKNYLQFLTVVFYGFGARRHLDNTARSFEKLLYKVF
jgi:hypothetical protein